MVRTLVILAVLVVCATCLPTDNKRKCPENSYWTNCGSDCEGTCEVPNVSMCAPVCLRRCRCIDGYLWNGNGCVLPEHCPIA